MGPLRRSTARTDDETALMPPLQMGAPFSFHVPAKPKAAPPPAAKPKKTKTTKPKKAKQPKTAVGDEPPPTGHRRQSVPHRELCDARAVRRHDSVRHHDETLGPFSEDRCEYRVQGAWLSYQLE